MPATTRPQLIERIEALPAQRLSSAAASEARIALHRDVIAFSFRKGAAHEDRHAVAVAYRTALKEGRA